MASVATAAQVPVWPAASELTQPVNALASGARFAQLASVTCPSVGNCTAVGSFTDSGGLYQPMVATEVGGVWGRGRQLSLPANASASSPSATLLSVACTSAGNCVAVGSYNVVPGLVLNSQPMVITEVGGVWGQATQLTLPANAAAPSSQLAGLRSVSCAAAGSCVAVGHYIDSSGAGQAMVATAANGLWAPSTELALPSDASLAAQNAGLGGVACASPANCVAVGYYVISSNVDSAPMVANETGGVWAPATRIALPPGAATALQSQIGGLDTVTCPAAGNCVAGGYYADTRGFADLQAMTVAQTSGVWAQSVRLKLPANLSTAASTQNASVNDISCRSVGTCVAVGVYRTAVSTASQFDSEAMVATETAGAWAHATQLLLPADAVAGSQFAPARGVSCPAPSRCSAVGSYIVTGANSPISPMVADSVGSLSIPTTSLPWGRVGSRYRGQLAGAGGSGGYGWAITGGSLPKGLRLDPRLGLITGTPRTSGWAHFTVSLADSGPPPQTVTRPLALNVMAPRRPGTALRSSVISARHRSARFSFVATGVSTGFQCALQGISHGPSIKPHFTSCRSPKTYTRLRPGSYVFSVAATGPAGPDPTPATRTFTIN